MLAFRKQPKTPFGADSALTLRTAEGAPLYTFPGEVINSMRHMETALLYKGVLPARIAMVAALREEGVTYSTLALATTLAYDLAVRVCVVELNWWSPGMNTQPEPEDPSSDGSPKSRRAKKQKASVESQEAAAPTSGTHGLAAVLTGALKLDDALVQTALPNLALLPAGDLSPAQRPAMARGDALKACIEQLGHRFDHLLLDIPAILATSDAMALASLGAACCVIVRQGVTPVSNVRRALDDIKHLPMLGVVLNQSRTTLPRWVRALIPQE
jgi:Mrp family chromosome partitioning ATPase